MLDEVALLIVTTNTSGLFPAASTHETFRELFTIFILPAIGVEGTNVGIGLGML